VANQPGSPGNNGMLPDDQSGSPLGGVGSQSSNCAAGELTVALWTTAAEPTPGGPGTAGGGNPNRNLEAAHKCPCTRRTD